MKEGKYAKTLSKNQVTAIFLMQDMWRNFFPEFVEISKETLYWSPSHPGGLQQSLFIANMTALSAVMYTLRHAKA